MQGPTRITGGAGGDVEGVLLGDGQPFDGLRDGSGDRSAALAGSAVRLLCPARVGIGTGTSPGRTRMTSRYRLSTTNLNRSICAFRTTPSTPTPLVHVDGIVLLADAPALQVLLPLEGTSLARSRDAELAHSPVTMAKEGRKSSALHPRRLISGRDGVVYDRQEDVWRLSGPGSAPSTVPSALSPTRSCRKSPG